jgi:predicted HTH domain antitoxin
MTGKTLSIRITDDYYNFLSSLAKSEQADVSKKVRELVDLGRIMLAIDKYKKSEASLEKASRLAGVSISEMMDIFSEYGVQSNLEYDDYLKGLRNIEKIW